MASTLHRQKQGVSALPNYLYHASEVSLGRDYVCLTCPAPFATLPKHHLYTRLSNVHARMHSAADVMMTHKMMYPLLGSLWRLATLLHQHGVQTSDDVIAVLPEHQQSICMVNVL